MTAFTLSADQCCNSRKIKLTHRVLPYLFSPPVILGVTNPFFAKTLQHWPHIVRFGDTLDNKKVKVRKAGDLKTLDNKPGMHSCCL